MSQGARMTELIYRTHYNALSVCRDTELEGSA